MNSSKILFGKQILWNKELMLWKNCAYVNMGSLYFPLANFSSSGEWKESLLTNPYTSVHDLLLVLPKLSDASEFSGQ